MRMRMMNTNIKMVIVRGCIHTHISACIHRCTAPQCLHGKREKKKSSINGFTQINSTVKNDDPI